MPKTNRRRNRNSATKKFRGGKTFASNKSVKLTYLGKSLPCEICQNETYEEIIGTLDKSKVRSGVGQLFFGDMAGIVDSTSVLIYVCKTCGYCRIIRNKDPIKIIAEDQ
jgi:hypothetical protein